MVKATVSEIRSAKEKRDKNNELLLPSVYHKCAEVAAMISSEHVGSEGPHQSQNSIRENVSSANGLAFLVSPI